MKLAVAVMLLALATAAVAAEMTPPGRSVTGAGYAFRPDPQDYYPETSRELNEQGLAKVKLCYDLQGKPVEVTLDTTSGYTRLDEAAVRYGRAVRIRPGSVNGELQTGCVVVPVRFSPTRSPPPSDQGERALPPVQVPPDLIDIPLPPPPVEIIPIPLAPSPPDSSIPL
jgi:TonB family protein